MWSGASDYSPFSLRFVPRSAFSLNPSDTTVTMGMGWGICSPLSTLFFSGLLKLFNDRLGLALKLPERTA